MDKVFVVIPAAGVGKRMNMSIPKQFIEVNKKNILDRSIEKILLWAKVYNHKVQIIVSLADDINYSFNKLNISPSCSVSRCNGGKTRASSIINAVNFIKNAKENDWIMSHDAVRPLVSIEDIENLWNKCRYDSVGGILAEKVASTVKLAKLDSVKSFKTPQSCTTKREVLIEKTINRDNLYLAQTPQIFRYNLLKKALTKFEFNDQITDESSAIEMLGFSPKIVVAKHRNTKVTTAKDLAFLE